MVEIRKFANAGEIAAMAASITADTLAKALETRENVTLVLAGGRLPPKASDILAKEYANAFDWQRVIFLIGDERCVPLNNPESSWVSILPLFNAHPEIPHTHILRPKSDLPAEQAAKLYAETLSMLPLNQSGIPIFTQLWLGMGEDGHTLSVFPDHPSEIQTTEQLVIPVHDSPKPPPNRITFSYKALEGVESAIVFVSGVSKAPILARIANGDHSLPIVTASRIIEKAGGHVIWLIDQEALSKLSPDQQLNLEAIVDY
jgi:6-phosphogluconolactonase